MSDAAIRSCDKSQVLQNTVPSIIHTRSDENAICIPNETISEDIINKLPNKEQLILIYCRSGNRSNIAYQKLTNLGYTVYDLGALDSIDLEKE